MRRLILLLLLVTFSGFIFNTTSLEAATNEFDFQVEPVFPDSQIGNNGYYHIEAVAEEPITLKAKVINRSDKEMTINIHSMDAYSGSQGILYQKEAILQGSSITDDSYFFKQTITHPEKVILAPLASEVVEFTVNTPALTGTLLGSLSFEVFKGTESLTSETENSQLLIDQYRAINIGVQLDVSPISDTASLAFGPPSFSPEELSIRVPVENPHPVIINSISGSYTITKEGDASFSVEGEIPTFKMAPMTKFDYPIQWSKEPLLPGNYKITATFNLNGEEQFYNEILTVEQMDLDDAQTAMVERGEINVDPGIPLWIYIVIGTLLIILLVLIAVFVVFMRKFKRNKNMTVSQKLLK